MITTALEYRDVVRMLAARGTASFYAWSRRLYGSPKDKFPDGRSTVRDLGQLLYGILTNVDEWSYPMRAASPAYARTIEAAEAATREGMGLHLRLAIDYSGREAIVRAARTLPAGEEATPLEFGRLLGADGRHTEPVPELDLLIRTGGEQRLSDFMLWECAYTELVFTERLWPDFDAEDLGAAVREFRLRDRRFGRILESVPAET